MGPAQGNLFCKSFSIWIDVRDGDRGPCAGEQKRCCSADA
jgi:hypothetical protein